MTTTKQTPMMRQWHQCKVKAKDALLLFRLGDFYEAFYDDAKLLAKTCNLTLTARHGIPMSGIPVISFENHAKKLLEHQLAIAIAEQLEDPKDVQGIVKRDIVQIISPGANSEAFTLEKPKNNFFMSICQVNTLIGWAKVDLSTSELIASEVGDMQQVRSEILLTKPAEILLCEKFANTHHLLIDEIKDHTQIRINLIPEYNFDHHQAINKLTTHFKTQSLDGFGLKGKVAAINATGALFTYLSETLYQDITHLHTVRIENISSYMQIDHSTQKSLEIFSSSTDKDVTLLHYLNRTETPMGYRMINHWLHYPLLNKEHIDERLDAIEELIINVDTHRDLIKQMKVIRDLERLAIRIEKGSISPSELLSLNASLLTLPQIKLFLSLLKSSLMTKNNGRIIDLTDCIKEITEALSIQSHTNNSSIFKQGYSTELDQLYWVKSNSQQWVASYQEKLRISTNIKSLKVNYSKAFGYFIEVSRAQSVNMPAHFERRQTLVNNERFISPELKEYESKILGAKEMIHSLEKELYQKLLTSLAHYFLPIQKVARVIAEIDVICSLTTVALENNLTKPQLTCDEKLSIHEGRHPIIESHIFTGFIPNDAYLDTEGQCLKLITGPNMGGKSTYIRQVALITIMAQIGSFVPATSAKIGIVDKVFSRIGASDDLSRGQSTFMVEMSESANILNNATSKSLVILDEIGRGTSTYDGIAIAYAIAKDLLSKKCKTLFATHYSELTTLELEEEGAINYELKVQESEGKVIFLHKVVQGKTDKSYAIHVAGLAGISPHVLSIAKKKLLLLDQRKETYQKRKPSKTTTQLLLFEETTPNHHILDSLKDMDIERLTPLEALQQISRWKNELQSS